MALSDNKIRRYVPNPSPKLEKSQGYYFQQELTRISNSIEELKVAVEAIQAKVDSEHP